jgi:release factor glutamine methyltransferase
MSDSGSGGAGEVWDVRRLLRWSAEWLARRGIASPRLDGELLLADALGVERLALYLDPDRPLTPAELQAFKQRITRRAAREPVAYILGQREFWSRSFRVGPGVLVPRPETECLIEAILARVSDRQFPLSILDLGVGSGVLLLTLLQEFPRAHGTGIDCAPEALAYAQINAQRFDLLSRAHLLQGDLCKACGSDLLPASGFDLIVSNPPYIGQTEWSTLQPEVRDWEPATALVAAEEGQALYRQMFTHCLSLLRPSGWLVLEIGATQGAPVRQMAVDSGLQQVEVLEDYARHPRVVVGQALPRL